MLFNLYNCSLLEDTIFEVDELLIKVENLECFTQYFNTTIYTNTYVSYQT